MPDPLRWNSKILLFKPETTYGTDPTPAGANGILASDVVYRPMEGEDVSRDLEYPDLGAQAEIPTGLRAVLEFSTELQGSGTAGTAPAWGPLARACGLSETIVADTSVTYAPVTDDHESATTYIWIGGTRQVITGMRGTGVLQASAQGIPRVRWTMTGLFASPSEETRVSPDLSAFQKPLPVTDANTPTFTANSVSLVMRSYELNLGNDVQPRLLVGREEIMIVDKAENIAAQVEAVPVSTFDPYALAEAQTEIPVVLTHGTQAGRIITVNAGQCQVRRPSGFEVNQGAAEWPLQFTPLRSSGNDQFSIVCT